MVNIPLENEKLFELIKNAYVECSFNDYRLSENDGRSGFFRLIYECENFLNITDRVSTSKIKTVITHNLDLVLSNTLRYDKLRDLYFVNDILLLCFPIEELITLLKSSCEPGVDELSNFLTTYPRSWNVGMRYRFDSFQVDGLEERNIINKNE